MAKFITLKQITEELETETAGRPFQEVTDDGEIEGEDDGIRQVQSASAVGGVRPSGDHQGWKPNTISVDVIRNFYPRKHGRPGSRVVLKSGVAYVVVDTHDEIMAMISA